MKTLTDQNYGNRVFATGLELPRGSSVSRKLLNAVNNERPGAVGGLNLPVRYISEAHTCHRPRSPKTQTCRFEDQPEIRQEAWISERLKIPKAKA
ncbi:hypothetical protein J6590_077091, partial [Homalodisca vitripennis]